MDKKTGIVFVAGLALGAGALQMGVDMVEPALAVSRYIAPIAVEPAKVACVDGVASAVFGALPWVTFTCTKQEATMDGVKGTGVFCGGEALEIVRPSDLKPGETLAEPPK